MKTIAIINMKGGCAKTTTSVNMGYILAEDYDKKVLIIDNDKQGNLSKACGVWNDEAPSFADVLTGDKTLTDVMQLGANGNIAVVPANMTCSLKKKVQVMMCRLGKASRKRCR